MEITVMERRDYQNRIASWFRLNEIYMTNATSMVNNVLSAAGSNRITRLNIVDHGNRRSMQLGDDIISDENIHFFRGTLSLLRGHFAESGFVHLQHCDVGQNLALLRILAQIWQVPVYAGTDTQRPVFRHQDGVYVRCDINGNCYSDVRRP